MARADPRSPPRRTRARVPRVRDSWPERGRLALTLRGQRQMSSAEVAEAMGISVTTVEIYVSRGLAALRENSRTLLPHRYPLTAHAFQVGVFRPLTAHAF